MKEISRIKRYYIACGYTDMRFGIDGLACVVREKFKAELEEETLFLFCGRRADRIKALLWCGDGYLLLYKRLSNGRFQWPRSQTELRSLNQQTFRWLMEGLSVEQPKAIRQVERREMY